MTNERFTEIVEATIKEVEDTLIKKTAEYNTGKDRLSIFKRAADLNDNTASEALLGFVSKQICSLYEMVGSSNQYSEKVWHEKIGDIIVYMFLLKATLVDDDRVKETD